MGELNNCGLGSKVFFAAMSSWLGGPSVECQEVFPSKGAIVVRWNVDGG